MPARPQQIIASPPRAAHVAIGNAQSAPALQQLAALIAAIRSRQSAHIAIGSPQSAPVIQQLAAQLACNPFPAIRSIRSPIR